MSLYPNTILRCQHIKINGTQCGSPSLRETKYVFTYHIHYYWRDGKLWKQNGVSPIRCPPLEGCKLHPNVAGQDDRAAWCYRRSTPKPLALVLYALQTASMNLKHTTLGTEAAQQVVIDRQSVARRPRWSLSLVPESKDANTTT